MRKPAPTLIVREVAPFSTRQFFCHNEEEVAAKLRELRSLPWSNDNKFFIGTITWEEAK